MNSYSTTDFGGERASLRKQLQAAETAQKRRKVMRAMTALKQKEHAETYEKLAKE